MYANLYNNVQASTFVLFQEIWTTVSMCMMNSQVGGARNLCTVCTGYKVPFDILIT